MARGPEVLQGITTHSRYDTGIIASRAWVRDIHRIGRGVIGVARCVVTEDTDGLISEETYRQYNRAFAKLQGPTQRFDGLSMFAVCPPEFFSPRTENEKDQPNAPFTEEFTNAYIDSFAQRLAQAVDYFYPNGVLDYTLWNEPNVEETQLSPTHVAALLSQCRKSLTVLKEERGWEEDIGLYLPGIFTNRGDGDIGGVDEGAIAFIDDVYAAYRNFTDEPFPWDGITIHIHRLRDVEHVEELFRRVREVKEAYEDPGKLIVGEFGTFTEEPEDFGPLFAAILAQNPDLMINFLHQYFIAEEGESWGARKVAIFPQTIRPGAKTALYPEFQSAYKQI